MSNKVVLESDSKLELVNGVLFDSEKPFSGILISKYHTEALKSEIQYRKGKKHGFEKKWSITGDLLEERFYIKGLKSGIHKAWWQEGSPQFEYHFNDHGEFHGMVKEWYASGQQYMDFNYVNGKENGNQRLWKEDGAVKANYTVINNERFGLIGLKKCYTVTVNKDEIK